MEKFNRGEEVGSVRRRDFAHHYDRAYEQASKRSRPNDFDRNSGERKGVDQGGADELFLENLEEQTHDDAAELLMKKYDKVL